MRRPTSNTSSDHRSAQGRAVEECPSPPKRRVVDVELLLDRVRVFPAWLTGRLPLSPSPGRLPQSAQNDRIVPISLDMFELPVKPKVVEPEPAPAALPEPPPVEEVPAPEEIVQQLPEPPPPEPVPEPSQS